MALKVNTNVAAINAHRNLLGTERSENKNMQRLSSGYRINSASDDAAGLAIANRLRSNTRSLTVAAQNTTEAKSELQIAEGAGNKVESILERMKELATQASSANVGSSDLTTMDAEFQSLIDEIDRIVDDSNYQGTALVDGTFSGTFQVGSSGDASSQIHIAIDGMDTNTLDVDGLSLTSATNATNALASIDAAVNTVSATLGDIGASMNRLDYTYDNLQVEIENFSASESAIRDVDMASEMVSFTKNQVLMQAGTAMLAQANSSSQTILTLLQ